MKISNEWKGFLLMMCFFVPFSVISGIIGEHQRNNVEKNGVYTVMTLDEISYAPKGGKMASMHYTFRGQHYEGGTRLDDDAQLSDQGRRFFMMVLPDKPKRKLTLSDPVPVWFTLEAPEEGWKTKPTKMEMYRMMVQDSIAKGLIVDTIKIEGNGSK